MSARMDAQEPTEVEVEVTFAEWSPHVDQYPGWPGITRFAREKAERVLGRPVGRALTSDVVPVHDSRLRDVPTGGGVVYLTRFEWKVTE